MSQPKESSPESWFMGVCYLIIIVCMGVLLGMFYREGVDEGYKKGKAEAQQSAAKPIREPSPAEPEFASQEQPSPAPEGI